MKKSIILLTACLLFASPTLPTYKQQSSSSCSKLVKTFTQGFIEGSAANGFLSLAQIYVMPYLGITNPLNISTETLKGMVTVFLASLIGEHYSGNTGHHIPCITGNAVTRFIGILAGACSLQYVKNQLSSHLSVVTDSSPVA